MSNRNLIVVFLLALPALSGCDRKAEANSEPRTSTTSAVQTTTSAVPPAMSPAAGPSGAGAVSTPASAVARIVFVDKENCCACTRRATDASWAALQEALGGASIPIERIHMDTQADQAGPYLEMQAMVAVPGIYFLDALGGFINMLQGEVTASAIRAILFP
jgi:hypothetical protein